MAGALLALAGALAVLQANGGSTPADGDLPLTLSWTAPEGCPAVDSIKRQVAQLVHLPSQRAPEPVEARGVVRRSPDGSWSLELETKAGGLAGTRTLSSKGCDDLTRAGAVVLALMINAAAPAGEEPSPATPAPTGPPRDVPASPPAPAPPAPNGSRLLRVAAAVDALFSAGQLPRIDEGAGLRLEVGIPHLTMQARGAAWLSQRAFSAANANAGGDFNFYDVGGALCPGLEVKYGFAAELCVGAAAAFLRGSGFGVAYNAPSSDWWAIAFAGPAVRYRISTRFEARLAGEVWGFPFGRPTFELHEYPGPVYGPAAVSGRVALGLQFYL